MDADGSCSSTIGLKINIISITIVVSIFTDASII
jgi:hypothetical protein